MASLVVNRGLQVIGGRASNTADAFAAIQTMSWDDSSTAFAAANTSLGSPANVFDQAFDATPTRSSQTITHLSTVPTGSGNFTIRRVALHNDTAANVTGASASLVSGVDGQSLAKTSDFTLATTLKHLYTSV